ncbi:MAG: YkgJ family cysteine cluster protein [Desulfobacteraceae bacterium]|nr:YkgJ family cysteine cluster protein [Desulfobacteraceae bacterium]
MKIFDKSEKLSSRGIEIGDKSSFLFECHPGVTCFNKCCRNLNLYLYPHDIVMLRKKLGITSGEFIDNYTEAVLPKDRYFPEVLLKMADNEEQTCPFLTEEGCSVYESRPDSCRNFPVEHGVSYNSSGEIEDQIHLFRPPEFCQGRFEKKEHTVLSWAKDQNAVTTNKMTLLWSETAKYFYSDIWGGEGPYGKKAKMVFMAAYNIDGFREFVFNSTFLKRYKVKKNIQMKIRVDDEAMLKFSLDWIGFFALGFKSDLIKLKH